MMTDSEPLYDVRERTGNPEHPSVNDVVDLVLERAENPRAVHQDAHLDEAMATVVDRYGSETVRTIIQRVLVDAVIPLAIRNRLGGSAEKESPVVEPEFHRVCAILLG